MVDGEVVVAHGGEIHTLNLTAARVWAACEEPTQLSDVADLLADEFGADPDTVRRDVLNVVRSLIEVGLAGVVGAVASAPTFSKPLLQPAVACSACGPGPQYEAVILIDVGAGVVAIGCDAEVVRSLEGVLGNRVIGRLDPAEDRPAYGVVLPQGPAAGPAVEVARLHRGPDVLLRSREPGRVLDALLAQVATHVVDPGAVVLEGLVVGRGNSAVVVPVPANRVAFERDAARVGLSCADIPSAVLLADSATVRVGAEPLVGTRGSLAELAASRRRIEGESPGLDWGRYDLRAVVVAGTPNVASVLGEFGPSVDAATAVPDLPTLIRQLRPLPVRSGDPLAAAIAVLDVDGDPGPSRA